MGVARDTGPFGSASRFSLRLSGATGEAPLGPLHLPEAVGQSGVDRRSLWIPTTQGDDSGRQQPPTTRSLPLRTALGTDSAWFDAYRPDWLLPCNSRTARPALEISPTREVFATATPPCDSAATMAEFLAVLSSIVHTDVAGRPRLPALVRFTAPAGIDGNSSPDNVAAAL
jgi:hypothetical protein